MTLADVDGTIDVTADVIGRLVALYMEKSSLSRSYLAD